MAPKFRPGSGLGGRAMAIVRALFAGLAVLASAAAAVAGPAAAAAPRWPDVDAIVTYRTRQVLASGVTRSETWQERLVRRGDQVWTERLLPPAAPRIAHDEEPGHAGHRHLNAETSARWLGLAADGGVMLRLVDHAGRQVVEVPRAEFPTVAFDGRHDAAATIVPPAVARAMHPTGESGGDARWRADRSGGWSHRVLWSESRQIALRVDSRRDDGSVERSVSVRLLPPPAADAAPWQRLAGYARKRYDEFMD